MPCSFFLEISICFREKTMKMKNTGHNLSIPNTCRQGEISYDSLDSRIKTTTPEKLS